MGLGVGFALHIFNPSPLPFPLFFPVTFAIVFALVSFVAAEQMLPVLFEMVIGFVSLAGGALVWHHFAL